MTPEEKRYIELSQDFDVNRRQIKQIEGEYDFLLKRMQDFYAKKLADLASEVIYDPKAEKIFGTEKVKSIKKTLESLDEDIPLDRDTLVSQLKEMNQELQRLHSNQSSNCKQMNDIVQSGNVGKFDDDLYLKAQYEDAIDESQETYQDMCSLLSGQYEVFDTIK